MIIVSIIDDKVIIFSLNSESSSDESTNEVKAEALSRLDLRDIHSLDVNSKYFKSLPTEVQYEILSEIKERRKQNSWNKMSEMPQNAEGFSGFQLERLRKRKQVQSTLENVGKTLGEETAADLDANLFVGDREGLKKAKKEMRRIVSSQDGFTVMLSAIDDKEKDKVELCKMMRPVLENRELKSSSDSDSSDVDSDDEKELLALKMAAENDMSQDEILALIKSNKRMEKKLLSDASDDEVQLLEPQTVTSSLRRGGKLHDGELASTSAIQVKEEPPPEIQRENVNKDVLTIEIKPDEVDIMSDSGSSEEEDLFADIFSSEQSTSKLDSILASTQAGNDGDKPRNPNAKVVESVTQFDHVDDVFAQVSKKVRKFSESEKEAAFHGRDKKKASVDDAPNSRKNEADEEVHKNIADSMKKSDHLWLKIASKWADDKHESQPSTSKPKPKADFEVETANLVKEMKQKEREDRLMRFKKMDTNGGTKQASTADENKLEVDKSDKDLLCKLGVEMIEQSQLEKKVMENEGWTKPSEPEQSVVYGDAAPGFIRSKKYDVVEVELSTSKESLEVLEQAVEKLNHDEDEDADNNSALTEAELIALQERLAKEQDALIAERGREERLAASMSDQMYADCQELLRLFGIPWVVSPTEAEAQCAFLDETGLSHGTITDDSDIWVFGGRTVYKNFFEKEKYCETFSLAEVTKHFGLTREKMILLAMLTGSDYTEGISNVGPVTGMEILAEFVGSGITPLEDLKSWWTENQNETRIPGNQTRAKLRKLQLPNAFPQRQVYQAYIEPVIDRSEEKFTWAVPNFVAVRDFATEKFGWSKIKIDEVVKPVIKKMSGPYQGRIDNFFLSERNKLPKKGNLQYSRRVQSALAKVIGTSTEDNKTIKEDHPKSVKRGATGSANGESAKRAKPSVTPPVPKAIQTDAQRKLEAKKRAAEVFKKSQAARKKRERAKQIKRKVLDTHNLSESESD